MSPRPCSRPRRIVGGLSAVVALGLGLAACGDDDTAAAADAPTTIQVRAVDFSFEDLPERVPAGTTLTLVNDAPTELHELVAVRLPDDEERSVDELVSLPPDELGPTLFAEEPAAVLLAAPGGEQVAAVGDGTLREPGRYLIMCVIPTGVDPDEYFAAAAESEGGPPQIENAGPPHIAHGMFAELVVE
jgi:hypothetical protein